MTTCQFDSQGVCSVCFVQTAKMPPAQRNCPAQQPIGQVGTVLSKILASMGFVAKSGCACRRHADQMNAWGPQGCAENIETIVEWLKEEATARGLPFFAMPAKILVRRAIANARKESRRAKEPDQ